MKNILPQTLALHLLPACGAATFSKLQDAFGSLEQALQQDLQVLKPFFTDEAFLQLSDYLNRGEQSQLGLMVNQELELCEKHQLHIALVNSEAYPKLLAEIKRPPPVLYVKGNLDALDLPQIAIVGSRKPTPIGQTLAKEFASSLCASGFVVTSGLALGVDAMVHRGAVAAGGKTVAVLGSGLLNVYPRQNMRLAEELIASGGALLSEFPLRAEAKPHHFPQRNRIVSGLSCGVLVVEAALKSGSLITARYALQQDREVFAIPGSIRSEVSHGCHAMIKSGAKLVESPKDIVEELEGVLGFFREKASSQEMESASLTSGLSVHQQKALEAIGFDECVFETILERSQLTAAALNEILIDLELRGCIANTGNGYIRLNNK